MADVFISYSRKDSEFARKLIDQLNLKGKGTWVDWEGIPLTSPNWWLEIKTGIEASDSFLFIMSPNSMASVVCNMELDYALELGKRIIPVVYVDVVSRDAFASIADFQPDEAMQQRLKGKDPLNIARDNWQNISHINWLFFRKSDDFDVTFNQLINTVETDLPYVKAHTRYLTRATEWQRENHPQDLLLFGEEIERAQVWLKRGETYARQLQRDERINVVNPIPQQLHYQYIHTSKSAQRKRRRILQGGAITILLAMVVGAIAITLALNAQNQVALSNALRSTIEFEGTVFGVQQARAGTHVAGLGLIPEREQTLSSQEIIAEATAVATRIQWHSVIETFDGVEMVKVPAGCFLMGDGSEIDTQPVHETCIAEFWIDRYEVTNEQFKRFEGQSEYAADWEDPKQPRTPIRWSEAHEFCKLRDARLPTEAEWEYAARGPDSIRYPWGNDWDEDLSVNSFNSRESREAQIVGSYADGASWVGAYDMSGNVWEWVNTTYDQQQFPYPYATDDGREDRVDLDASRGLRGGAFDTFDRPESNLRGANRYFVSRLLEDKYLGFRCARNK